MVNSKIFLNTKVVKSTTKENRRQVDGIVKKKNILKTENSVKYFSSSVKKNQVKKVDDFSEKINPPVDDNKRMFLKVAGVAGLGLAASALFPKGAEAYVAGSTPTSNVVGIKNITNTKINPATEDGNLATIAGKDFATQTTLASIKTQADKLTFDVSNNLKVVSSGGSSDVVGLKDASDVRINPPSDDSLVYLRRIVKLMESQGTVDAGNRQRITIDSIGPATAITTTIPVSGTVTATISSAAITTLAGQNQQMYQDVARNAYANGIRQNLIFS